MHLAPTNSVLWVFTNILQGCFPPRNTLKTTPMRGRTKWWENIDNSPMFCNSAGERISLNEKIFSVWKKVAPKLLKKHICSIFTPTDCPLCRQYIGLHMVKQKYPVPCYHFHEYWRGSSLSLKNVDCFRNIMCTCTICKIQTSQGQLCESGLIVFFFFAKYS